MKFILTGRLKIEWNQSILPCFLSSFHFLYFLYFFRVFKIFWFCWGHGFGQRIHYNIFKSVCVWARHIETMWWPKGKGYCLEVALSQPVRVNWVPISINSVSCLMFLLKPSRINTNRNKSENCWQGESIKF